MSRTISPLTSVVLDSARFLLAFLVAAGHFTQPQFQEGWPDLCRGGVAAVGGFFVLSGFTIRLLTPEDEPFSPSGFVVERLSRLWSVALPAVVLTVVLDGVSFLVNRAYYLEHWGGEASMPLARIALNVGFASQIWGRDVALFSNSLFWSLGYEAGFYFLYWVHRSTRGHVRYLLTLGGCVLLGPNIVLLLVPWLAGVQLYDMNTRLPSRGASSRRLLVAAGLGGAVATAGALVAFRHTVSQFAIGATESLRGAFARVGALAGPLPVIRFDAARIEGELIVGAAAAWVILLCALAVIRGLDGALPVHPRVVRVARRLGDFTFPLYLFHFPMFVLAAALGAYNRHSGAQKALAFAVIAAVIYALLPLTNAFKWTLRRALARAATSFGPVRASPDVRPS